VSAAAIDALERAYRNGEGNDISIIKVDPLLDELRGQPRFEALGAKNHGAEEVTSRKFFAGPERRDFAPSEITLATRRLIHKAVVNTLVKWRVLR
jgi:hypothetical protein